MDFDMKMLAYCGLYCEQCSCRAAFASGDWAHLEHFPATYKKERPNLSDYDCGGCKGRSLCGACDIRDCAAARRLDSCADCGDFPCGRIEEFGNDGVPHHHGALKNLHAIRDNGVDAWFEGMRPALRCHCGERLSWYHACPRHS